MAIFDLHALFFQQRFLLAGSESKTTQPPIGTHHPMTRNGSVPGHKVMRVFVESVPDRTVRLAVKGQGDVAVGRDVALRNAGAQCKDAGGKGHVNKSRGAR
ncbi:MAG TPA: hypothetical protein VI874_01450 [Candidatus Norongarragalinales archaeon]|nr:hypothetical protein [Candidatus Norongarragalinales archaeon]